MLWQSILVIIFFLFMTILLCHSILLAVVAIDIMCQNFFQSTMSFQKSIFVWRQFSTSTKFFSGSVFSLLVYSIGSVAYLAVGLGTHIQIYIYQMMDKYNYNCPSIVSPWSVLIIEVNPRASYSRESIGAAGRLWYEGHQEVSLFMLLIRCFEAAKNFS